MCGMRRANPEGYWFHAKAYGYGWGLPATWQGWLILLPLPVLALLVALAPGAAPVLLALLVVDLAVLLWACFAHGEPARWRWGRRS